MAVGVKVVNRPGSFAQQAYLPAIAEGLGVTFRHFLKNFFGNRPPTASELLDQAYARGELSRDEYLKKRDDLAGR